MKLFADDAVLSPDISRIHDANYLNKTFTPCPWAIVTFNYQVTLKVSTLSCRLCNSLITCRISGAFIQDNLEWGSSHVKSVRNKARNILDLPCRNYSQSSEYLNTLAYNSLVRPHVEYVSSAWSPFDRRHITALEDVRRSAIRFACSVYSRFLCVTSTQQSLGWDILKILRHISATTMMHKAVHNLAHLIFPPSVNLAYGDTRSNHPYRFRHISTHGNAYKFSFSPRTMQSQWPFPKGTPYQLHANIVQLRNVVYCYR